MFEKLIFYNHFGNGDIFESREFVLEYIQLIPAEEYLYAHGKHPSILKDLPLNYTEVTPIMHGMKPFVHNGNDLYVNTWIGRDGRYVLPGIGCTVEMLHRMHNDQFQMLFGVQPFIKPTVDYIPDIDYSYYETKNIDAYMADNISRKKVYISNGPVQSNQAENFDFNPVIDKISDLYPDTLFFLTQKMGLTKPNVVYTEDIIQSTVGFDLNECSYLSTFCDVLIGRNSGPHVFAQVKRNWLDPTKKILSFTYTEIAATFVLTPMPMRKYWSNVTVTDSVVNKIKEVLDE